MIKIISGTCTALALAAIAGCSTTGPAYVGESPVVTTYPTSTATIPTQAHPAVRTTYLYPSYYHDYYTPVTSSYYPASVGIIGPGNINYYKTGYFLDY